MVQNVIDPLDALTGSEGAQILTALLHSQGRTMPLPFGQLPPFGPAGGQPAVFGGLPGGFPGGAFPRDPHAHGQPGSLQE